MLDIDCEPSVAPPHGWTPAPRKRRCEDLPAVQGTFVSSPEDFHVEEIPAYLPCGDGEHAYLWLQKTNLPADALFGHVSRVLKVSRRDIGYAGLKDTRATTVQFLSVPRTAIQDIAAATDLLQTDQVRLIRGDFHQNKLRCGHLRGNRFTVTLRNCHADDLARAQAIAARLQAQGMPNYYGNQRFGRDHSTLRHGLALLKDPSRRTGKGARQAWLDKLALSAVQSALFNDYLASRTEHGARDKVLHGDVLQVCASGGLFVSDDPPVDQARFDAHEVVPAGPMFGPSMKPATDAALELEEATLVAAGLRAEAFTLHKKLTQGTRRASLIWLDGIDVTVLEAAAPEAVESEAAAPSTQALRLQFTLPSGSYATEVIEEFVGARPSGCGEAAV